MATAIENVGDSQQVSTSVSESMAEASTNITSNETLGTVRNDSVAEEGPHMMYLRQALHKTVKKCCDAARYTRFAKSYKFAHRMKPQALKSIVKQFAENLQSEIEKELELMIDEENLVPLFNDLDQLIKSSEKLNKPAWRPSGNPEKDAKSHIMQAKLKEKERLELMLKHCEEDNVKLHEALIPRKQHLLSTQDTITHRLNMFQQAAAECDKIPGKEIQQLLNDLGR